MNTLPRNLLASCLCLTFAVSCAQNLKANKAPGANLAHLKTFYVQQLEDEDNNMEDIIANQLNAMGYQATHGKSATPPQGVDAHVTYVDRWMWDITMYLLKLSIQIRDPKTQNILASGESMRTSLVRRSPEKMAREVLEEILKK